MCVQKDKRKCAHCPGETITLYNRTPAGEKELQGEWYDEDYDAMVQTGHDCRMLTHKDGLERMQRLSRANVQRQEMMMQEPSNKRIIQIQQQTPGYSTIQVICNILATSRY